MEGGRAEDNHINDNGTVDHIATLGDHTSIAMFGHAAVGDVITGTV
jgi:hypothetical protein